MQTATPSNIATPPAANAGTSGSALLDPVENKAHINSNSLVDPNLLTQPIGEATIGASNVNKEEDIFQKEILAAKEKKTGPGSGKGASSSAKTADEPFRNPDLTNLPPAQQNEAAENMSKMIISGYERGNKLLDGQLQIKEKTLLKIRVAGTIDMDVPLIPVDGGTITFDEFVRTYNEQNEGTISVSMEFKEQVTPILTRVLAKRGHGLSDEQMLLYLFGGHMTMNLQKFWAQKQTLKAIMEFGREMTKQSRSAGDPIYATAPAPSSPSNQPAPPPPPPSAAASAPPQGQESFQESGPGAQGQTDAYKLPTWGGDSKRALDKAARRGKGAAGIRPSSITADPPSRRKRVGNKKG